MPSRFLKNVVLLFGFLAVGSLGQVRADLIDNFNNENGGAGTPNYTGFANFTVTQGSVDLIGPGFFDFLNPGMGLSVDLNGSTGVSGALQSKAAFGPGTYVLSFDLANNYLIPGDVNSVTVLLGSYSETFTKSGEVPFTTYTRTVTLTSAAPLIFSTPASDFDDAGVLLDNVSLVSAVPEPGVLALAGAGSLCLVGLQAVRRRGLKVS